MPWQSEEAFRESAGKASGGLPKKHIHVDSATPIPASLRTGGLLYQAEASEQAAAHPALKCPCCGEIATDIAGAKQVYQIDVPETGGKSHKGDVPPAPIGGLDLPPMLYSVEPCGCRVSQEWAGSFSAELQSRMSGNPPKGISDMTARQRAKKVAHYQDRLSALYSLQSVDNPPQTKEAIDYWIVICADQLQRLCPGAHNKKPMAKPLEAKVQGWANTNGFQTPPLEFAAPPPPVDDGTPLYRMTDGTVSPVPAYEGQVPCGIAQGPPDGYGKVKTLLAGGPKLTLDKQPKAQDVLDAAVIAAQAGLIGANSIFNVFGQGGGPVGKSAYGDAKGVFANQATAPQPKPEVPTVEKTRNGQFAVRYGDIYKVFVTVNEANDYAAQLMNVTPGFAAGMKPKPTLQTLPVDTDPKLNVIGGYPEEKEPYLKAEAEKKKEHLARLKKILMDSAPDAMPKKLVQQILGYTYSHKEVCFELAEQAFGPHGSLITRVELLNRVQTDLNDFVYDRVWVLKPDTVKFVKKFVDLVEFDSTEPATVEKPQGGVPPGAGSVPVPVPPPPVPKHVKKKRTIRKIED